MPVKRPAPPSGTGQPKSPPVTRKMIVVAGAVIALLILLVLLRPLLTAGLTNLLAGSETGNLQKMTTPPAPTLPVDYRGEGAFVDSVVLTTEPTQTLAKATDLYIEANKDPTNAEVTVQFTGGGGMGLVKDNTIILTRSDGSVISGKLDFNQKLSEVTLQGTRGTDRLQVIVTMKSGVTYTIIDRLIPYRFRSAT